jgi:hypothetical protein
MQLQLNVHRLVVVYRVPALDALDASTLAVRLERWRIGAEHAGWKFGWRDAPIAGDPSRRFVETYCYAFAGNDFLENEPQQLYWRTDIVQMTRYYMIRSSPQRHSPLTSPHGIPGVNVRPAKVDMMGAITRSPVVSSDKRDAVLQVLGRDLRNLAL